MEITSDGISTNVYNNERVVMVTGKIACISDSKLTVSSDQNDDSRTVGMN